MLRRTGLFPSPLGPDGLHDIDPEFLVYVLVRLKEVTKDLSFVIYLQLKISSVEIKLEYCYQTTHH